MCPFPKKVKLISSVALIKQPAMNVDIEVVFELHAHLISELVRGEWSSYSLVGLSPIEKVPATI